MPLHKPTHVLVLDSETQRAHSFERTLERYWKTSIHTISDWSISSLTEQLDFDTVMFTWQFTDLVLMTMKSGVLKSGTLIVFIADTHDQLTPDIVKVDQRIVVPYDIPDYDTSLVKQLEQFLERPLPLPSLSNAANLDEVLRLQIQRLDRHRWNFESGKQILVELVAQFLPRGVDRFTVHRLGQGFSGAIVFRILYNRDAVSEERVLKLTPDEEHHRWRCHQEVQCYQDVKATLGSGPVQMIPHIHGVTGSGLVTPQPARRHGWFALMYSFIRDPRFDIVDFEKVSLDPGSYLPKGDVSSPEDFLGKLFKNLLGHLHRKDVCTCRKQLWSTKDASEIEALTFPPYCFRKWEKGKIIESIYSLDPYGESLFPRGWKTYREAALRCVPTGRRRKLARELRKLQDLHSVLLCPVHGDLNANNVLMALDFGLPFLIDFACYQPKGHAVQDFARLEVAVKIELMGKEKGADIKGKDLNSDQFEKWCAAERRLSLWPENLDMLSEEIGKDESVLHAYKLCQYIRKRAREIHQQLLNQPEENGPNFELSYNAALLYHTLRAVRYESLPQLKRVFAVYSVSRIVEQFRDL